MRGEMSELVEQSSISFFKIKKGQVGQIPPTAIRKWLNLNFTLRGDRDFFVNLLDLNFTLRGERDFFVNWLNLNFTLRGERDFFLVTIYKSLFRI